MPEAHYHVRSRLTGARVIIDVTRKQAEAECKRMNRECETGERAAYGEGDDHVPAERLVPVTNGQALALDPKHPFRPEDVGRILHDGEPMEYEVEVEQRPTEDEIVAAAEASA
jgi:hypothetical protein